MITAGMMTSKTPEWETPQALFDELNREFGFTLDPCSNDDNAKCARYYTKADNGLLKSWLGHTVFMNPPYGREITHWMEKAYLESKNATVVCLVPARTDTKWWHEYAIHGDIRFLRGRLKFGNGKNSAPFPSAIVIFRERKKNNIETKILTPVCPYHQQAYVNGKCEECEKLETEDNRRNVVPDFN